MAFRSCTVSMRDPGEKDMLLHAVRPIASTSHDTILATAAPILLIQISPPGTRTPPRCRALVYRCVRGGLELRCGSSAKSFVKKIGSDPNFRQMEIRSDPF